MYILRTKPWESSKYVPQMGEETPIRKMLATHV